MTTGYLTQVDLINFKLLTDKLIIDTERISDLITEDIKSEHKIAMIDGVNYYNNIQDIEELVKYYYIEQVKVKDEISANNTLSHPFHKILVDQKSSYIVGNPITLGVDVGDPENPDELTPEETKEKDTAIEFSNLIDKYNTTNFDDLIHDWVQGSSNKATEWIHFYINAAGDLNTIIVPSEQLIPIYDTQYENELVYMIRYYVYDYIDESFNTTKRYKVEWWSKTQVEYFVQIDNELFVHDPDYLVNPSSHWRSFNTKNPKEKRDNNWEKVPFVCLKNNTELNTDLHPIKILMDSYDKVKSGWCNDLEDFQELVLILRGYSPLSSEAQSGMSELAVFLQNLKTHKVISVDNEGGVDALKAEIPTEAKEKFLQITRKEIFYFGEGVDIDSDKFGNNPSGISLKFLYGSLDLKANRTIRKLTIALDDYMWFLVFWINFKEKKQFESTEIKYTFNKSLIFNEKEKIESVNLSADISERTRLENHPWVMDVEEEIKRKKLEKEKADAEMAEIMAKLPIPNPEDEEDDE